MVNKDFSIYLFFNNILALNNDNVFNFKCLITYEILTYLGVKIV